MKLRRWKVEETYHTKNLLLVDFDGTLASYTLPPETGIPNLRLIEAVELLRQDGAIALLWTGRISFCKTEEDIDACVETLEKWLDQYGVILDGILIHDKPRFKMMVDDRMWNVANTSVMFMRFMEELNNEKADTKDGNR